MRLFDATTMPRLALDLRRDEEVHHRDASRPPPLRRLHRRWTSSRCPASSRVRGGILDVYSPEMDRPVRIDFFGDEIESIRSSTPKRSAPSRRSTKLCCCRSPKRPSPEKLLAAVNARLSRAAHGQPRRTKRRPICRSRRPRRRRSHRLPRLGVLRPRSRCRPHTPRSPPQLRTVFIEEPAMVQKPGRALVEQGRAAARALRHRLAHPPRRHLPLALGSASRRSPRYRHRSRPARRRRRPRRGRNAPCEIDFATAAHAALPRLHPRAHRAAQVAHARRRHASSSPPPTRAKSSASPACCSEYSVPYRLGSRIQHTGSETVYDESSYLAGDLRTPIIVNTAIAAGVQLLRARRQLIVFGANDLSDEADVAARPVPTRAKSKTAAFVSDFRDLTVGDYVVHVEHGIAPLPGPEGDRAGRPPPSSS